MRTILPILLALCGLLPLASKAEDGPNLITNPGFENPPDSPATYNQFTGPESKDAKCRFAIAPEAAHSGTQGATMRSDDFARFAIGPKANYPVVTGDFYRVGVWIKAGPDFQMQAGGPGVAIRLSLATGTPPVPAVVPFLFIYPGGKVSQADLPNFSPLDLPAAVPTEWTHIEAVVKVPPGVETIGPYLFFWKAKGSLYVDDFSLQKVDPTTPVTPIEGAPPASKSP